MPPTNDTVNCMLQVVSPESSGVTLKGQLRQIAGFAKQSTKHLSYLLIHILQTGIQSLCNDSYSRGDVKHM